MRTKLLITMLTAGLFILIAAGAIAGQKSDTWLGVYTQSIDEDLMEAFELDQTSGAIIKHVIPDSPADQAGLEQGDIIIKLGNKKLDDSDDLSQTVGRMNPGEEVDIIIIRDGKKKTIAATLGSSEDESYESGSIFKWFGSHRDKPHRGESHHGESHRDLPHSKSYRYMFDESFSNSTYIGLNLENLTDQLGEYFGVKENIGILITEVLDDSPAKKAGLRAGDVIIKVDGEKIADISDIQKAVRQKEEGEEVELTLLRNKKKKEYSIEVAESPESFGEQFLHRLPDRGDYHKFVPEMKGMFYGNWNDKTDFSDENKEALTKMKTEIDKLKKELKAIKKKIN